MMDPVTETPILLRRETNPQTHSTFPAIIAASTCPASTHKSWGSFLADIKSPPEAPLDLSLIKDTTLFTNPGGSRSARLIRATLHLIQSNVTPTQFHTIFDFGDHVIGLDLKPINGKREYRCEAYQSIRADMKVPALFVKSNTGDTVLVSTLAILNELAQRVQTTLGDARLETLNMNAHAALWQKMVAIHDRTNFPPVMNAFTQACAAPDATTKQIALTRFAENEAEKWENFYALVENYLDSHTESELKLLASTTVGLFIAITYTGMDRVANLDPIVKKKFESILAKFEHPESHIHALISMTQETDAFKASDSKYCTQS